MKLKSAQVTNYRNITDSGKFSVGPLTCLVGKNEAGKTSILTALNKIHPVQNASFNPKLDYPRLGYADFKAGTAPLKIVVTEWQLDDSDIKAVEKVLVPQCTTDKTMTVTHSYKNSTFWTVPVNDKKVVAGLIDEANFNAPEKSGLTGCANTESLYEKLSALENLTEKQSKLKEIIKQYRNRSAVSHAADTLKKRMPKFLYSSHYDRMAGAVSFDRMKEQIDNEQELEAGEAIFHNFLSYAGVTLEDIEELKDKEDLLATLESASAKITRQMFKYWSQNQNLKIKFDIRQGMPEDAPPLNTGTVLSARVWNDLHDMSVDFSERSAGFVWFFSFIVQFSQMREEHGDDLIILLDEPGLSLHGMAQADLLEYIREELLPTHQVLYTTHSPFMIPISDWDAVKTVEDVVKTNDGGKSTSIGAKVSEEPLKVTNDTLFPLQGALGYKITQSLFIGANVLLVEGASDVRYLQTMSTALRKVKRTGLSNEWTICPVGGIGNIRPFVSLFSGANNLRVAALIDYTKKDQQKLELLKKLRESSALCGLCKYVDFCEEKTTEADVEDLFPSELFSSMVNGGYELWGEHRVSADKINKPGRRILEQVKDCFHSMPDHMSSAIRDHYRPANWLAQNPDILKEDFAKPAMDRFEKIFKALNGCLDKTKCKNT